MSCDLPYLWLLIRASLVALKSPCLTLQIATDSHREPSFDSAPEVHRDWLPNLTDRFVSDFLRGEDFLISARVKYLTFIKVLQRYTFFQRSKMNPKLSITFFY